MELSLSVDVNAPPDTVWRVLEDVETWPEWTSSMSSVRKVDGGALREGSRVEVKQPRFPRMPWTVTSLEQGRSFEWETRSLGAHTVASHGISSHGEGSRVTLRIDQRGALARLMQPFIAGITRRYVETEAAGLKQRAES